MGHDHHHGHSHGHSHQHGRGASKQALLASLFIITLYFIVEVIGGFLTNSLALLSDAGHMLSDASALLLSLLALHFASRPPSARRTFGMHRFEILAALTNGVTLVVISLLILWEAYQRLLHPPEVQSGTMVVIAFVGLLANIAAAFVLMRGDYQDNMNVRSAYLHVLSDLLGSIGAILGGILMWAFDWYVADPLISIVVAVLIMLSAWRVTKESVHILLEGAPSRLDAKVILASPTRPSRSKTLPCAMAACTVRKAPHKGTASRTMAMTMITKSRTDAKNHPRTIARDGFCIGAD